jgi:cell division protein FtsB
MATPQILDSLVKIASAGTSGVCVFAIFYSGNYLIKAGSKITSQQVKIFKFYMLMCIGIAIISAGSGIANAYYKYKEIETLKTQNASLNQENANLDKKVQDSKTQIVSLEKEKDVLNKSVSKTREELTLVKTNLEKAIAEKAALNDKFNKLSIEFDNFKRRPNIN